MDIFLVSNTIPSLLAPFKLLDLTGNDLNSLPESIFLFKSSLYLSHNSNLSFELPRNTIQLELIDTYGTNLKYTNYVICIYLLYIIFDFNAMFFTILNQKIFFILL